MTDANALCHDVHRMVNQFKAAWEAAKTQGDADRALAAIAAVASGLAAFSESHADTLPSDQPDLVVAMGVLSRGAGWFEANGPTLIANQALLKQGELFFEDVSYLPIHVVVPTSA